MNNDEFPKPGGSGRKIFLAIVLLVVGGAFAWDFLVAKPAYEKGVEQLQQMLDLKKDANQELVLVDGVTQKLHDTDGDGIVSPAEVHAAMNGEPASSENPQENTLVETWSWQRGFPTASYKAWVLYTVSGDKVSFYKVMQRAPTESDYRQPAVTKPGPGNLSFEASGSGGNTPPAETDPDDDGETGAGESEAADSDSDEGGDDDQ